MFYNRLLKNDEQKCSKMMNFLFQVGKEGSIGFEPKIMQDEVYFWVDENILFLDPVKRIVRAQGLLTQRTINALERNSTLRIV